MRFSLRNWINNRSPKRPSIQNIQKVRKIKPDGKILLKVTIDEKGNVLNTAVERYDIIDNNESSMQGLSGEKKKDRKRSILQLKK